MKKFIAVLMAVMMVMMATACGSKTTEKATVNVLDIQLSQEEYAYAVNPNKPELVDQMNAFLAEAKENGTFDAIINNYFGDGEPVAVASAAEDASKDQLIVVTEPGFEPFEYMAGDKYLGVDMEMAQAFADYLGKELVIKAIDFDAIFTTLSADGADLGMAGITYNETRAQLVNFSETYYNAAQKVVYLSTDETFANCKTLADIEGVLNGMDAKVKVGVQTGTTGQAYVDGSEDFGFAGLAATSVGFATPALAIQAMMNGDVDFVICDEAPADCISRAMNAMQ